MTEFFGRLSQLAQHAVGKIQVRSALNGCLWLTAIALPFGLCLMLLSRTTLLQVGGFVIAFSPMMLFGAGFIYFMVKNPDKLRSEDYEIRMAALSLIEEKGGAIPIAATSIQAISNPDYPEQQLKLTGPGSDEA